MTTPTTVSRLVRGDYLPATRETVTASPVRGVSTPPGKLELVLSGDRGTRAVVWGAGTTVRINRAGVTA